MGHLNRLLVLTALLITTHAAKVDRVPLCTFETADDVDYPDGDQQEKCELANIDGLKFDKVLNLQRKNIQTITSKVLSSLTQVTKVDLSENILTQLPPDLFLGLENVVEIDLGQNHLTVADFSHFANRTKLQIVNFGHNKISKIQPANGVNITNLRLNNNNLRTVSDLCRMTQLEALDVSTNPMLEWTDFKFKCWPNMKTLNLSDSNLKSMNNDYWTAFGGMTKLELLNITKNGIVHLCTVNYPTLPALGELYVNHNKLRRVNVEELMGKFPKLNKISVSGNAWNCDFFIEKLRPRLLEKKLTIVSGDTFCDLNSKTTEGEDDSADVCAIIVDSGFFQSWWFYLAYFGGMLVCLIAIVLICSLYICKKE